MKDFLITRSHVDDFRIVRSHTQDFFIVLSHNQDFLIVRSHIHDLLLFDLTLQISLLSALTYGDFVIVRSGIREFLIDFTIRISLCPDLTLRFSYIALEISSLSDLTIQESLWLDPIDITTFPYRQTSPYGFPCWQISH